MVAKVWGDREIGVGVMAQGSGSILFAIIKNVLKLIVVTDAQLWIY